MHIKKVNLENIRSFDSLEIDFEDSGAGWHVILGTNGTGKSTLIRSIALALVGEREISPLTFRYSWQYWLRYASDNGNVKLSIGEHDVETSELRVQKHKNAIFIQEFPKGASETKLRNSLFSVAYGSFRRITGGSPDYKNIWDNHRKLAAHLSVFGEDIALDQSILWLISLYIKTNISDVHNINQNSPTYDDAKKYQQLLSSVQKFVNKSSLLPNNITLSSINHESVYFKDKNNLEVPITELSDGYRSILSLTLELLRQLCRFHKNDITKIFSNDKSKIITKGIILIDEIDAHLHPTWQTKIGEWFTKHFPNIQFIVTTHSPIICRSAGSGTIWKLSNEGTSTEIKKIKGIERKQLLYGSILDAFETDIFGEDISRSKESQTMLKEMAVLNVKRQVGRTSKIENKRLKELEQIFQTDAQDNFLDD